MCTKTKVMLGVSLGLVGVVAAGALITLGVCARKTATKADEGAQDAQAKERMAGESGHDGSLPV